MHCVHNFRGLICLRVLLSPPQLQCPPAVTAVSHQVTVSSCDLLVVSVGQMSMPRAINLTQKLWSAGITAEIMYDWSQVRDRKL